MKHVTMMFVLVTVALLMMAGGARAAKALRVPPDLTKGETNGVDRAKTYNLGPTWMRGWIYTKAATYFDSVQGRTTSDSRQILVTHVGTNSPAFGVMQTNDVILGINGKLFDSDARQAFGRAITESEKTAKSGVMSLVRFRNGKTENIQLKLKVMGSYSETAPYDCEKSKLILANACKALEKEKIDKGLWGAVQCLALLSSGDSKYLPTVKTYAHSVAPETLKLVLQPGMCVWDWGYKNLLLCEYYLATGDKEVLHGINEYTVALAKGQSMYGTYGHGISALDEDGGLHGSIPPYGALNQAGLIASLSVVMGKKCGVKDPEVDAAIWRASKFFSYYVDKGSIPYGEHMPWPYHENNGKNALAAVFFATQGNQNASAQFFAKMCAAAYANREYGHTGQGFSYLWGMMGANAGGPAAAAAFMKEALWHLDLVRRSDGSFTYDGGEQYGAGKTGDNTYYGASSYYGLSPNACYVLSYALPLKQLYITGKDANKANWLTRKDVGEAVASGRFDVDRGKKSTDELPVALGDWSPIVRGWAAEELGKRHEAKAMVSGLISMAEGKNPHVRQGACEALGYIKDTNALPVLVRLLTHEDRWLRVKAADALKNMGDAAKPVLPGMLKAVVDTAEPLKPIIWDDPFQLTHGELAAALFEGLMRNSIEGVDRKLLYPAIRAVAHNADGMARGRLNNTLERHLTDEDVRALAPDILAAVMVKAPADTMFGNSIRMSALKVLVKNKYKEGIHACVHFAKTQGGHGSEGRTGELMKLLLTYGAAAREEIPELKELIVQFNDQVKNKQFPGGELNKRRVNAVEDAIKVIEAAKDQPELRSIVK